MHLYLSLLIYHSNMNFHKLFILIIFLIGISSVYNVTYAECDANASAIDVLKWCSWDNNPGVSNDWTGTDGIKELVKNVAGRAIQFAALFAIWAIVWSGIRYTTSYGDDEKVKKAKSTAIYALIWLILALLPLT